MKKRFIGKSLEECVQQACEMWNVRGQDIKYRIIEEKRGLLRKKITIEAIVSIKEHDGALEVIDNQIRLRAPIENGRWPKLKVSEGVSLYYDEDEVEGEIEVREIEKVRVEIQEDGGKRELNLGVSEDELKAFATVNIRPMKKYKLKAQEEDRVITLERELKEEEYPDMYTKEEIIELINQAGIIFGLKEENIEKLIETYDSGEVLIAEGIESINPVDDYVEVFYQDMKNTTSQEWKKDFKAIGYQECVESGELLVKRIQGINGQVGKNVKGEDIPVRQREVIELKAGEGCNLVGEDEIYSTAEGKVLNVKNTYIISPVHEIKGNIDISTGNVIFEGEVFVSGDVEEGMKVSGGSGLMIRGNVSGATAESLGTTVINGKVLNSTITIGALEENLESLLRDFRLFKNRLDLLIKSINEVLGKLEEGVSEEKLIIGIINMKFSDMLDISKRIIEAASEGMKGEESIKMIEMYFKPNYGKMINLEGLNHLREIFRKSVEKYEYIYSITGEETLTVSYLQDSSVECCGDVIVDGLGQYISDIKSGGSVYFKKNNSVVRGGNITANNEIHCEIVGSPGAGRTELSVPHDGKIKIKKVYQNTVIHVGKQKYYFDQVYTQVEAYQKDGILIVEKLK